MISSFLTTTSTEGLKPLGTVPQRSYELISGTVRAEFSETHAALFAEPVPTQYGDRFDWHATVEGKISPLAESPDADSVRETLGGLVADIRAASERLIASKDADDQRLGEALANALEIPDESAIFVVEPVNGGPAQPVIVNWAWTRDAQVGVRGVLSGTDTRKSTPRAAPAAAIATTPVAAANPMGWWWLIWLGWLLLALIIAAIIALLIEPCGLRAPFWPNTCERAEPVSDALAEDRSRLEDQIALVQKEIHIKDRLCQPDFAQLPIYDPDRTPPAPNLPSLPQDPAVDDRAEAAGARRGDLTFTLIWEGADDLDLYTTCPTGESLFFLDKARCNGIMDLDMNGFQVVQDPVENAFFTNPIEGTYRVRVNLYRLRGNGPRDFTLQIRDGDEIITHKGRVSMAERNWQYSYQYRKK